MFSPLPVLRERVRVRGLLNESEKRPSPYPSPGVPGEGNRKPAPAPPVVQDPTLSHIIADSPMVLDLGGLENDLINNLSLGDCDFSNITKENRVDNTQVKFVNVTVNGKHVE